MVYIFNVLTLKCKTMNYLINFKLLTSNFTLVMWLNVRQANKNG